MCSNSVERSERAGHRHLEDGAATGAAAAGEGDSIEIPVRGLYDAVWLHAVGAVCLRAEIVKSGQRATRTHPENYTVGAASERDSIEVAIRGSDQPSGVCPSVQLVCEQKL